MDEIVTFSSAGFSRFRFNGFAKSISARSAHPEVGP